MRRYIFIPLILVSVAVGAFEVSDMSDRPRMRIIQIVTASSPGITLVDASLGKKQGNSVSTLAMVFTKVPAVGNMVVCGAGTYGGGTFSSSTLKDNKGNTYLMDVFQNDSNTDHAAIWHITIPGSYADYTATFTVAGGCYITASCLEVSGQNASPSDLTGQNTMTSGSNPFFSSTGTNSLSSSTTQLAVAVVAVNSGGSFTPNQDASWTSLAKETNGSCCEIMDLSYKLNTSLSNTLIISTWTKSGTYQYSAAMAAYKY